MEQLGYAQAHGEQVLRCSAIAEFSAGQSMLLPFNPLASNPLENVWRAIAQLDLLILAIPQEPNGLQIDKVYFGQIEDRDALSILDTVSELYDTTGAEPPDQTEDRPPTVGFCFNSKH